MLRYSFNRDDLAVQIENAVENVLEEGFVTSDIFADREKQKCVSTSEFGDLVANNID